MDVEEFKLLVTIFKPFIVSFKGLWMIKNDSFKRAILDKYECSVAQASEKIA